MDVLISPVTPAPAPKIGSSDIGGLDYYTSDALTVSSNLAGLPSLSAPVGLFNGLPLGIQMTGRAFEEQKILDLAYFLQEEFQAYKKEPEGLDNE